MSPSSLQVGARHGSGENASRAAIALILSYVYSGRPHRLRALSPSGRLNRGQIEALVKILRSLQPADEELAKIVANEAEYFERNIEWLRYPAFRSQVLFVGSGVVEAGCKIFIGAGFKCSGMSWAVRGANATIALRCCRLSRRFEDYRATRARAGLICHIYVIHVAHSHWTGGGWWGRPGYLAKAPLRFPII